MTNQENRQVKRRLSVAQKLVKKIGKTLHKRFYSGNIQSFLKEGNETVTEYDLLSDQFLKKNLLKKFNDSWLSEESAPSSGTTDFEWVLDPIDGTNNFSVKIPFFCISLALKYKKETVGAIVYDPVHKITYLAYENKSFVLHKGKSKKVYLQDFNLSETIISYGINEKFLEKWKNILREWQKLEEQVKTYRRFGSAALEIVYVGLEKLGLYFIIGFREWDIAAALLFAQNAGAKAVVNREKDYLVVYHPAFEEKVKSFIAALEKIEK